MLLVGAIACSSAEDLAPTPTPIDAAALIQQALDAQPQGITSGDIAKVVSDALRAQPGVSEQDVANAIVRVLQAQPGVTQDQVASAIVSALSERPGVTQDQVASAIASALSAQPGVTQDQVAAAITSALSAQPGVSQAEVQAAIEAALANVVPAAPSGAAPTGKFGGTVRWAEESTQATLDVHKTTTGSRVGAANAQETLFAFDANLVPQPNLVESWSSDNGGLNWEFKLRSGIKYHNGDAFDSTDAVESYKRWAVRDNFGQIVDGFIALALGMIAQQRMADRMGRGA